MLIERESRPFLHIDEVTLHRSFWSGGVTSLDFVMRRFLFGRMCIMSCVSFWSVGFIDDPEIFRPTFEAFTNLLFEFWLAFRSRYGFLIWALTSCAKPFIPELMLSTLTMLGVNFVSNEIGRSCLVFPSRFDLFLLLCISSSLCLWFMKQATPHPIGHEMIVPT